MSFGMIFSIILIVVFIAFSVYAVFKFIDMQQDIQIRQFKQKLQEDVDLWWKRQPGDSWPREYYLPDIAEKVCFTNEDSYENLYFVSDDNIVGDNIKHLELGSEICFDNVGGKVSMTLVKVGQLVRIE